MGLQNQPFLGKGLWQAQISYQYGSTDQWFYGSQRVDHPPSATIPPAPATAPGTFFGTPPQRTVNIFDLDVLYGVTNRLELDLTVPFLTGTLDVVYGTLADHQLYHYSAGGIGDVSLQAEYWLNDPTLPSKVSGSVSLGIKAPTGKDDVTGTFFGGKVAPIDEGAQLGNGGWELLLRAQGTAGLGSGPFMAYGSGYYGMSLTETSGVPNPKPDGSPLALRGVPDTYSARLGAGYVLPVLKDSLILTAGGRINGVTVKDIIGGTDLYWRRPGYEIFFEPGLSYTFGRNVASVSVPVRVYAKKLDSTFDASSLSPYRHVGSDFVPFLVIASFGRRF